nr:MAG TPA: hypothetical protein [Caudoviricetes sp.]
MLLGQTLSEQPKLNYMYMQDRDYAQKYSAVIKN